MKWTWQNPLSCEYVSMPQWECSKALDNDNHFYNCLIFGNYSSCTIHHLKINNTTLMNNSSIMDWLLVLNYYCIILQLDYYYSNTIYHLEIDKTTSILLYKFHIRAHNWNGYKIIIIINVNGISRTLKSYWRLKMLITNIGNAEGII